MCSAHETPATGCVSVRQSKKWISSSERGSGCSNLWGIAVQRSPVKKSFLKTHSILQPFSYLIHFVLNKRKIQSSPHLTGRRCWLQNPWRKAFLPPAPDPASIERGTICLKRSWWLRDPDQAAVLHQVWFIDNPSAYMFLQDNIGFGKPFHIGGGGGVHNEKLPLVQWLHFQTAVVSAFDGGGLFLIAAGLLDVFFFYHKQTICSVMIFAKWGALLQEIASKTRVLRSIMELMQQQIKSAEERPPHHIIPPLSSSWFYLLLRFFYEFCFPYWQM